MDTNHKGTIIPAYGYSRLSRARNFATFLFSTYKLELLLFTCQWLVIGVWSVYRWHRMALTWDFSVYYQSSYLIAHGHLNPFNTSLGFPFYQNDFELIIWPIGFLLFLFRSSLALLLFQATSVSTASAIGLYWIRQISRTNKLSMVRGRQLTLLGFILLVLNPWIYWAISFDVHIEPLVLPFAILTAMTLWQGRLYPSLAWATLTCLGGNVTATYVVGIGMGGIFYRGHRRKIGFFLMLGGALTVLAIEHLVPGGIKGGNIATFYSNIIQSANPHASIVTLGLSLIEHPLRGINALWFNRMNLYGSIAPEGLVGLLALPVAGLVMVVLLENNLIGGHLFGSPQLFQSIPIMPLTVVGTIMVLAYVSSRWDQYLKRRWLLSVLIGLIGLNGIAWATIWIPRLPAHWVRISSRQAQILRGLQATIPANAELVVSNGFDGNFAGRQWIYTDWSLPHNSVPVHTRPVYFILSPFAGIEVLPPAVTASIISYLQNTPNVHLITNQNNIWAFKWTPSPRQTHLTLPQAPLPVPAWMFATSNGTVTHGRHPHLTSNGHRGYLLDHYYIREAPGTYNASISISNNVPINIEVWNATGDLLLARRDFPPILGVHAIHMSFVNRKVFKTTAYRGWGPFDISPATAAQNNLELRVWVPAGGTVNLYQVQISKHAPQYH